VIDFHNILNITTMNRDGRQASSTVHIKFILFAVKKIRKQGNYFNISSQFVTHSP